MVVAGPGELATPFAEAFQSDTGIELAYSSGETSQNTARLVSEAEADQLTIDVLISGAGELVSMLPQGLLQPLKPQMMLPNVTDESNWNGGDMKWSDAAGEYLFEGSRFVSGIPVINTDVVEPSAIKTWQDLLDPKYKGKIATYDPTGPGPGQGTASYIYDEFGAEFFEKLYVGQEITFTRDMNQLAEWVSRGTYPITLAMSAGFVAKFQGQGLPIQGVVPQDSPGFTTGGFSVIKQAAGDVPHPKAATVFINWFASCAGAQVYKDTMKEPSNRVDIPTEGLVEYAIPKDDAEYVHQYDEAWYTKVRPVVTKSVVEALQG